MQYFLKEIEQAVLMPDEFQLMKFTRKSLREYAKSLGVKRGKNKIDTVINILNSGRASIVATLGD